MSDDLPVESDTPDDHTVVGLRIEAALLPEWYDAVCKVAHPLCRRIAVIEKPEGWILQVEIPIAAKDAFRAGLADAWGIFVAQRRAEGRWEE